MRGYANLDERSDYYSVGCIFYYLLHGKYPIEDVDSLEDLDKKRQD